MRADEGPVFWHPGANPATVLLGPAPAGFDALRFGSARLPDAMATLHASDGVHLVITIKDQRHRVWVTGTSDFGLPLAAIIPLNADAPRRAEATLLLFRHLMERRDLARRRRSKRSGRWPSVLRALDGHLGGASYRVIAESLAGAGRIGAEFWKTSSLRDSVIRLVRTGVALMNGGYRDLLGGRRPD